MMISLRKLTEKLNDANKIFLKKVFYMKYTGKYLRPQRLLTREYPCVEYIFWIKFNQFIITFVCLRDGDVQYHHKTDSTKYCNSHDYCCLTVARLILCLTVARLILTVGFIVKIAYVILRNQFVFIIISSVS